MISISEKLAQKGGVCPVCGVRFRPNGVGPMSISELSTVLNKLPSSHLLRYGANWHDWFYHLGKDSGGSRDEADSLMWAINDKLIDRKCKWWNAWYYRAMNQRNYLFVKEFGDKFWNEKGCKTTQKSA